MGDRGDMGIAREVKLDPSFGPIVASREYFGYFPAVYRAQSLLPRLLQAEIGLEQAILYEESALTHRQKERLLLVLAAVEGNIACATSHYEMLRLSGEPEAQLDRLVSDYRNCLPAAEIELLGFGLKLALNAQSVSAADIDGLKLHNWSSESILDTVFITAWHRFLACVTAAFGAPLDFPPVPVLYCGAVPDQLSAITPEAGAGPYFPAPELVPDQFPALFGDLLGFVPNVFRGQAARPRAIRAEAEALRLVLSAADHLSRRQKELIVMAVSAANRNSYFVALESEILAALGVPFAITDKVALDHRHAGLDDADIALLDFALRLATEPSAFGAGDWATVRSRGFTDEQILEAVATTGLTKFLNTVQFGTGAVPDFQPRIALPGSPAKISNLFDVRNRPTQEGTASDPDADVIAKVRSGDSDAFEILVSRHSRRVYRTLLGILGNPDEACDAMQETFLKAYQHLERFESRSKFSTWLISIASNTGLQVLRGRKQLQSLDYDAEDGDEEARPRQIRAWADDPEQLYSKSEMRALVEEGVLRLPAKYRVVVMLRDIEQLSIEEAAAALNLGIPALKSRHLRGRLMLREALTPHFAATAKGESA